jgi:hypothetical protein
LETYHCAFVIDLRSLDWCLWIVSTGCGRNSELIINTGCGRNSELIINTGCGRNSELIINTGCGRNSELIINKNNLLLKVIDISFITSQFTMMLN